jgi:hypothetical protein
MRSLPEAGIWHCAWPENFPRPKSFFTKKLLIPVIPVIPVMPVMPVIPVLPDFGYISFPKE